MGFSTKIHINVDALGNPLRFILTAGQSHDSPQAAALMAGYDFDRLLADKSYDSDKVLQLIANKAAEAVIPPRANVPSSANTINIGTKNATLSSASSTKSSIIGASFLVLRS